MPARPRPGRWRHRVRIWRHQKTGETNAHGEPLTTPTALGERSCRIQALSGRERLEDDQVQAAATHRVEIRADELLRSLTPHDWLERLDTGRRLDVASPPVEIDEHRLVFHLLCNERTDPSD